MIMINTIPRLHLLIPVATHRSYEVLLFISMTDGNVKRMLNSVLEKQDELMKEVHIAAAMGKPAALPVALGSWMVIFLLHSAVFCGKIKTYQKSL